MIVPVQAEYYALEGLSQLLGSINLVKARLNPRLAVAGILLTMVDARTRLADEVEKRAPPPLRRPRLHHVRAPLGPPRRGAEPRGLRWKRPIHSLQYTRWKNQFMISSSTAMATSPTTASSFSPYCSSDVQQRLGQHPGEHRDEQAEPGADQHGAAHAAGARRRTTR